MEENQREGNQAPLVQLLQERGVRRGGATLVANLVETARD